jgi:hypothetical protein
VATTTMATPRPKATRRSASSTSVVPVALLLASIGLWSVSLPRVDLRAMTDLGLVSVLPVTAFVALGLLVVSFGVALHQGSSSRVLFLHVAALILMIHGTPAVIYDALRYAWAWKHVGVVDYIQRHGSIDTGVRSLSAYQNWPGFFTLGALLTALAGARAATDFAAWAPVFFNLAFVGGLWMIFRTLTSDRRLVWLAMWFFVLTNWVGQDYFAPQAMAFFLYLVLVGVCLWWPAHREAPSGEGGHGHVAMAIVIVAVLLAIVSSHQLTPFMAIAALAGLVVARQRHVRAFLLVAVILTAAWLLFPAAPFIESNLASMLRSAGTPGSNTTSTVLSLGNASAGQVFIALVDRGLTVAILALAVLGLVVGSRRGRRDVIPAILLIAPFPLVVASAYGGEMLFRVYFFALPGAVFLAATLIFPKATTGNSIPRTAFSVVLSLALLFGLLVSYYGKERVNYFTQDEVAASEYLYRHAPAGSVLVDITSAYPREFEHAERYSYVSLNEQTTGTKRTLRSRPVDVLIALMGHGVGPGYLIVTRSQEAEIEMTGSLPVRTGEHLVHAVGSSRAFVLVYRNRDASIFALVPAGGRPA